MAARSRPALLYVTSSGATVPVDTEAVPDPRERALYRALAGRAAVLADKADADEVEPTPEPRTGHYL